MVEGCDKSDPSLIVGTFAFNVKRQDSLCHLRCFIHAIFVIFTTPKYFHNAYFIFVHFTPTHLLQLESFVSVGFYETKNACFLQRDYWRGAYLSYKRIWLQRYLFVQRLGVIQITEIGQSDHEIAIVPTKKSFGSKNTKTQNTKTLAIVVKTMRRWREHQCTRRS